MSWVNAHIVCFVPLVVIWVDEVKVNIRVATFRHHVGPYHVFLKEKKQFSSKHQNKEKTRPETCKRDPAFLRLDLPRPLKRQCPQSVTDTTHYNECSVCGSTPLTRSAIASSCSCVGCTTSPSLQSKSFLR